MTPSILPRARDSVFGGVEGGNQTREGTRERDASDILVGRAFGMDIYMPVTDICSTSLHG